ncbi:DNA/RNA helicase domain-containing protein [Streptomyces violascens]|uniref:DNA/RNA helicase domain-containing protein n=1 Tax=Streptomyces violascens TaxID=67381 RepID=UPI00365204BF
MRPAQSCSRAARDPAQPISPRSRSSPHPARITARFCWPWSNPDGKQLVDDVRIDGRSMPWNVKPEQSVPDAPKSDLCSTDPRGIEQVGCVYTAQTFEYDWSGVIVGPDLPDGRPRTQHGQRPAGVTRETARGRLLEEAAPRHPQA